MKSDIRVAAPPPKPLMVFDGDCAFCSLWIRRWQQCTGDRVDYRPSQHTGIANRFPEIPPEHFNSSVQLIEPDGAVYSGAEAVFRSLARNEAKRWPRTLYESSPAFAGLAERCYRAVALNRAFFSFLTRFLWGRHVEQPTHFLVRWIFLRSLGLIYLIAFLSLWVQISGLVGSHGILPAGQFIKQAGEYFDSHGIGPDRYRLAPTLCWLNASDVFLDLQCAAGVALAVLLMAGVAAAPALLGLWALYLSLTVAGQAFLSFQWDTLLLETGFLAVFFAPFQWRPRLAREAPPSRLVLWLLRLLLFKLMFESGAVKLLSGDPLWHDLTALRVHYETQPLPTWIGWYAHQLPAWWQTFSCGMMFLVELAVPFLIFAPRRPRMAASLPLAVFQILILLTGNYTFFNWLTLALCLTLLDDFILAKWAARLGWNPAPPGNEAAAPGQPQRRWPSFITIPLAILFISVSFLQLAAMFGLRSMWFDPVAAAHERLAPFRSLNQYGLFSVMTQPRREIIVEGSDDGVRWLAYEFKYKPGDLKQRPKFVAPHQPRLDWQMWFAALGNYRQDPWFVELCVRLLQGSSDVLVLLEKNPFPEKPPRYIRAEIYDYHFTNIAERRATGAWWKRENRAEYLPPISIRETPQKAEGKPK